MLGMADPRLHDAVGAKAVSILLLYLAQKDAFVFMVPWPRNEYCVSWLRSLSGQEEGEGDGGPTGQLF